MSRTLTVAVGGLLLVAAASRCFAESEVVAELPPVGEGWVTPEGLDPAGVQSVAQSNPMLWQQYQSLGASGTGAGSPCSGGGCSACGGSGGFFNRCGCSQSVFPWSNGPGRCDSWCVGPRWQAEVEGLVLFREDVDWASVTAVVGAPQTLEEQFDHGPGARVFLTGYNEQGFGVQVGYQGVNDWVARSEYDLGGADRLFGYESNLNSVEFNFLPKVPYAWKFFGGFRYVELDEEVRDFTRVDKVIPAPADPPAAPAAFIDTGTDYLLANRLIGFQIGTRRDRWELNRWLSFELFGNAGVYCNKFKREDIDRTVTTVITGDDLATPEVEFNQSVTEVNTVTRRDITAVSYYGEGGASAVWRVNNCVALTGGYEVVVIDNVGEGIDALFAPGLTGSTLVLHGWRFGLEYRR